jgi:hypothetical protein
MKDLLIEILRTWNVMTKMMPIIIGVTGSFSRSFEMHLGTLQRGTTTYDHSGNSTHTEQNLYVALH